MPARRWPKLAILHKIETTRGTDAAPLAADAIVALNVTFTPIEGEEVSRDLLLPYMGNQGMILNAQVGRIEFEVELAGSGAAGTPPKYGSLFRAAGMAQTLTASVSAAYTIVEAAIDSSTLHFNSDGVRHVFLGSQADLSVTFNARGIPRSRFTLIGILGTVSDAALPTFSMTGWTTPVPVNKANTVLTLHGFTCIAESVELNLGNTLTPRSLIGDERILISDRSSTGTVVVEATTIAEIDWFSRVRNRTRGALSLVHGTVPGNIVEIAAPAVEIGRPTQGQTDNIVNYSMPLMLCPVSGRDEMTITIR
jgi:hypothetical protein